MLRQTILLSVGTICNKMINTMRRHSRPIPQLMTVVQQVSAVRSLYSFLVTHTHTHLAVRSGLREQFEISTMEALTLFGEELMYSR